LTLLDVHGTRVRVRGVGEHRRGTPLVFVHGAGTSSALWLGLLGRIGRHRRVVAIDLPGHGRSGGRLEDLDGWRDALGLTAAALCLGPSILVGHSLGGAAAMMAALAWPDKVAALALVAAAPRFSISPRLLERIASHFGRWPELYAELGYSPETPAEVRRRGAATSMTASQEQTLADFRAAATVDLRARLGEIACPTWILGGTDDLLTPSKVSEALGAAIPGAKTLLFPRVGHMPMHEAPDAFAGALLELAALVP
jgi:pimeloyl-ACP methyl ester carboxylesterase